MTAEAGFITAPDGVRLYCVKAGTSPEWLVAPGIGNEADFGRLTRRRTVVFFDVRNRGRSDLVPDSGKVGFPTEVDDIDTVRRHFDVDKVDIVGWSYLGLAAALYAARYPQSVNRLVMACPAPVRERQSPPPTDADRTAMERIAELYELGLDKADPVGFARAWRRITAPTGMGDPAAFERLRVDPSQWPNEWPDHMMAALKRVQDTHPADYDYRDEVREISAPTLIVAGEADRRAPLEAVNEWTSTIPGARLVVLPGVGHYPQAEKPESFFEPIDSFLSAN